MPEGPSRATPVTVENSEPEPSAAVFQPANVYPDLVGGVVGRVTFPDEHVRAAGAPVPPFASNMTLYTGIRLHCAYRVSVPEFGNVYESFPA